MMISATPSRRVSLHQLEDLRLDRHVERGRRLVGDDQLGIAGERDRDHDALAHAARELVRILLEALGIGDADEAQQLDRAPLRRGEIGAAMLLDRLGDLPADGQHRIERRHRLLEHHADVAAPNFTHLRVPELHEVAAVEEDLSAHDPPGRVRDEAQDRQRADRLARPAFADDRNGLAGIDGIGDAVDRPHESGAGAELGVQIPDLEEWYQDPSRRSPGSLLFIVTALVSAAK